MRIVAESTNSFDERRQLLRHIYEAVPVKERESTGECTVQMKTSIVIAACSRHIDTLTCAHYMCISAAHVN